MPPSTALSGCIKPNAVSQASSNLSIEDYRQRFRIKGVAFRLASPYGGLLVIIKVNSTSTASVTFREEAIEEVEHFTYLDSVVDTQG